jgi:trehalose 6-phosphate synthase
LLSRGEIKLPIDALRELSSQMLAERRLIIASNRGPVEFARNPDGSLSANRGSGGLVTALSALSRFTDLTWIASAMTDGDREVAAKAEGSAPFDESGMRIRFVALPRKLYQQYYNVVCNSHLWFLQHYMWNTPRSPNISRAIYEAWEQGYSLANETFAETIAAEASGDRKPPYVMVQDYHLYLVPKLVRERLPGAIIQHFTHIPWPDPRYWALLPNFMRRAIFENLSSADIVGLQTVRDTRNFLQGAEAFLPGADVDYRRSTVWFNGHLTLVHAYPIAVDAEGLLAFAGSETVREYEDRLEPLFEQKSVVRVDRAEPSKNLLRGFRAFELLIQRHAEYRGRVNMLAFIVPSRTDIGFYQNYTDEVLEFIDAINDEYGSATWEPITVFYENNYAQAIAAMRHYDVLLVNPVIDGMNLVAKEGPLVNVNDGVLLLSETAGAFEQLAEHALPVAPADIEGTVRALKRALDMPAEERHTRALALHDMIAADDIIEWLIRQFSDLLALA